MTEPFGSEDLRVLAKYETAGQGAWTSMPAQDKSSYAKIHGRLQEIIAQALATPPSSPQLDKCLTLGFNLAGGVRGNRPKDLWCAVFPHAAEAYMPQVYLIVSHRGVELGYAAAIHPRDFSDQAFRTRLKALAPRIFDALPDPGSEPIHSLSMTLVRQGGWYFRRKTRLAPKENDFASLEELIAFLQSTQGKEWGAAAIARYWLPHELTNEADFGREFLNALQVFRPLMVRPEAPVLHPVEPKPPTDEVPGSSMRSALEHFMELYPERRSRPFATDQTLWSVLNSLQQRLRLLPAVSSRQTIRVSWSVGQGNWARVPWISLIDTRVTDSTQRGIYAVLLFREDMSGVYLTLNQGVTEPKRTHGAAAGLQLLKENAAALRSSCAGLTQQSFVLDSEIDLRTDGTLGRDYEAATIAYKLYERGDVPSDGEIARDVEALLSCYDLVVGASLTDRPTEPEAEVRPIQPPPPYTMKDALEDLFIEQSELDELLALWRTKKNLILQGAPGVGKSFVARRLAYLMMGHRDQARTRMVQFHQAYAYEDFIQGFRPNEGGGFTRRDGAFFDFSKLAEADRDRTYVFIIDEINRGNLPKILGELMLLIEPDKRGSEFALPLAYSRSDEMPFSIPANLFILGLMNTADRSLAMIDYALRRRFAFHTLDPRFKSAKFHSFLEQRGANPQLIDLIVKRMTALNTEIASDTVRLGNGYQIGHSFFAPQDVSQPLDATWYHRVIKSEIEPLLKEYWYDSPEKVESWTARLVGEEG